MTGAAVPRRADTVVQERASGRGPRAIAQAAQTGNHIRKRGGRAGWKPLLKQGALLRPYEIALLAAQGMARAVIKPRVAVVRPATSCWALTAVGDGKIRDQRPGNHRLPFAGASAVNLGIVGDDPRPSAPLAGALSQADVVLTGGVSVGDFDYQSGIPTVGISEIFWKVAIKPGKPCSSARAKHPERPTALRRGNPIAALVCLEEFVRPALEKLQGACSRIRAITSAAKRSTTTPSPRIGGNTFFAAPNAPPKAMS